MNKYWEIQKIQKIALKIVVKNAEKTWSLGQRCQARGYDAIDQGTMLFFPTGNRDAG
jgi:hypothetical protein